MALLMRIFSLILFFSLLLCGEGGQVLASKKVFPFEKNEIHNYSFEKNLKVSNHQFRRMKRFLKDIVGHFEDIISKVDPIILPKYAILTDFQLDRYWRLIGPCMGEKYFHKPVEEREACKSLLKKNQKDLLERLKREAQNRAKLQNIESQKFQFQDWEYLTQMDEVYEQLLKDFDLYRKLLQKYYFLTLNTENNYSEMSKLGHSIAEYYQNMKRSYNVQILHFKNPLLREKVHLVWLDFFKPLAQLLEAEDKEGMIDKLEGLNFRFNDFHNVIKRDPAFKGFNIQGIANRIHFKWNLVLKIILK
jgi:hypothetical protein